MRSWNCFGGFFFCMCCLKISKPMIQELNQSNNTSVSSAATSPVSRLKPVVFVSEAYICLGSILTATEDPVME